MVGMPPTFEIIESRVDRWLRLTLVGELDLGSAPMLTDHQRDALTQFFAGHLSAGQLAERLVPSAPATQSAAVLAATVPIDPLSTPTVDAPVLSYRNSPGAGRYLRRWLRRAPSHASATEPSAV